MVVICGAVIYYTWSAQNWRKYKEKHVNTDEVVTHIRKQLIERLSMYSKSNKAQNCRLLTQ